MTYVKFEKRKKSTSLAFILLVVSLVFFVLFSTINLTTAQTPEKVATPTFNPGGGTYYAGMHVELSCSTVGATIRYAYDGSVPSPSSPAYSLPLVVYGMGVVPSDRRFDDPILNINLRATGTVTIKVKAFMSGMMDSDVATATYTFVPEPSGNVAAPIFDPSEGTYSSTQDVTLSCITKGATTRYTIDGSEPTNSSRVYISPISVSSTTTIKAKAFKNGMPDSITSSATYTISLNFPEPTTPTEVTKIPVAGSPEFWSPPAIAAAIIAATSVVIVPSILVYRRRGKQKTLSDEKPLPYQPYQTTPTNKPTVISRYNQSSTYGKQVTKPVMMNRSVQSSSYAQQSPFTKICPHCKRIVKDDYNLCPYCDKKLR